LDKVSAVSFVDQLYIGIGSDIISVKQNDACMLFVGSYCTVRWLDN